MGLICTDVRFAVGTCNGPGSRVESGKGVVGGGSISRAGSGKDVVDGLPSGVESVIKGGEFSFSARFGRNTVALGITADDTELPRLSVIVVGTSFKEL